MMNKHGGSFRKKAMKDALSKPLTTDMLPGSLNTVALRDHILGVLQNSKKTENAYNYSPERG